MKFKLFFFLSFLFFIYSNAQNYIFGKVTSEENHEIAEVTVINIRTDERVFTNKDGHFMISGRAGDELRFVKSGYERSNKKITKENIDSPINITLTGAVILIPEVEIAYKPTGNLERDSKYFGESEKITTLKSSMNAYMKSPLNEPLPNNSISKTFKGYDFGAGQVDMVKLIGSAIGLVKKASQPKITTPNYHETKNFIDKVRAEVNFAFLKKYGMTEEQIDGFLLYANDTRQLAKKYRNNYSVDIIESELKIAFTEYTKTHKLGD